MTSRFLSGVNGTGVTSWTIPLSLDDRHSTLERNRVATDNLGSPRRPALGPRAPVIEGARAVLIHRPHKGIRGFEHLVRSQAVEKFGGEDPAPERRPIPVIEEVDLHPHRPRPDSPPLPDIRHPP